jgi:hypothetical protein
VILATAQYYLRKLRELGSVAKLQEHVSHVLPPAHHERLSWAFSLIYTLGQTEEERTRRTDASLRRLLKFGTNAIDAHSDTPLADGTQCHWGKTGLKRRRDGQYTWKAPDCTASKKRCNVDGFFRQHQDVFEAIKKAIDALPAEQLTDQLRQFSDVIEMALGDASVLLNYQGGCRRLADVIIAVDSRDYRSFATQNYRESQVLTKLFRQRCYYLPNNPEHGIQFLEHDRADAETASGL